MASFSRKQAPAKKITGLQGIQFKQRPCVRIGVEQNLKSPVEAESFGRDLGSDAPPRVVIGLQQQPLEPGLLQTGCRRKPCQPAPTMTIFGAD
jgi:hypothetical protein